MRPEDYVTLQEKTAIQQFIVVNTDLIEEGQDAPRFDNIGVKNGDVVNRNIKFMWDGC